MLYRIAACVNSPSLKQIKIGNWVSVPCPLARGDLSGNHFKLTVRRLTKSSTEHTVAETIEVKTFREVQVFTTVILQAVVHSLKENGFVNYFGLQRFGGGSGNGAQIGLAMLQLDYVSFMKTAQFEMS